jgi:hypothetical protein
VLRGVYILVRDSFSSVRDTLVIVRGSFTCVRLVFS